MADRVGSDHGLSAAHDASGGGAAARSPTFGSIEAGRGIAALLVVLYHASASIFAGPRYWQTPVFGRFFDLGYAGVEFFFVLSGFIIAHVHWRDIGKPARLASFARRRFVRIYPVYWLVLAVLMTLALLPTGLGPGPQAPTTYVAAVLLAGPDNLTPWIGPAWTLFHEVLFYVVFALWIAAPRLAAIATIAWLAAIAASIGGVGALLPAYVASPLNLLFALGVAARQAALMPRLPAPRWLAIGGALGFLALGIEAVYLALLPPMASNLLFGLASAIGIAGVVHIERRRPIAVAGGLRRLGAASYAIYLTHFALLSLVAKLFGAAGLRDVVPAELAFVIVVGLVVAGGMAFHVLVEQPLRAIVEQWLRPAPAPV